MKNVVLLQKQNKVFVIHSLDFSLNKKEKEITQKSHFFLMRRTNKGEMGNPKRRKSCVILE